MNRPGNAKILIVDDSAGIRILMEKVLNALGIYNIIHASNGREALVLIDKARENGNYFDIILCDLSMPIVSGQDLLRQIRMHSDAKVARVGFLVITAESDKSTILALIKSGGIDGFLIKPVTKLNLFGKLNGILKRLGYEELRSEVLLNKV